MTFVSILIKESIELTIWGDETSLIELSDDKMRESGEEKVQLLEGKSYEYKVTDGYELQGSNRIVQPSHIHKEQGRITPGIYVGRLSLTVINSNSNEEFNTAVEVRSIKTDYRTEYRKMLEDITKECVELLMIHSSPVTQRYTVNYEENSDTLYQRFAFVKSIIDSDDFRNAIHRIIAMPVTSWKQNIEEKDIRRARKINASQLRQIASRSSRINLPQHHPLHQKMKSVPTTLTTIIKTDTVDTPENRFIKHALREFFRFSTEVIQQIEKNGDKRPSIYDEAKNLEEKFGTYLNHAIFKDISNITAQLPLNSPILQRKEGYRGVLKVWLMYDLAAKLIWNALDEDSYYAGKRDVATLYEYWLFFKLLRLIENMFEIKPRETEELIIKTKDGFGLQLQAGQHTAIEGKHTYKNRSFHVKFNYNRTFSTSKYPNSGSWTQQMRPDYTLSMWPTDFDETEAEKQELIVHIHFDAKYKVEDLKYLISPNDNSDLTKEKELQKEGTYKRADLLKMHAYKDAIRRTVGAYVLYPGKEPYNKKGFHEIVPGLGAFPLSPSNDGEGIKELEKFIKEVLDHLSNRASQREELSYQTYNIMEHSPHKTLYGSFPEQSEKGKRTIPPLNTSVLVGFVQEKQKEWIKKNKCYNIRLDEKIKPDMVGAQYLLLCERIDNNSMIIPWERGLYKILEYPKIKKAEWLINKEYKDPSQPEYFIYKIDTDILDWSEDKVWNIKKPENIEKHRPFTLLLSDFFTD